MDPIIFGAKQVGSRAATRVRVQAPQGSAYDGRTGTVVDVREDTVFVRMTDGGPMIVLPFGRGELVTL